MSATDRDRELAAALLVDAAMASTVGRGAKFSEESISLVAHAIAGIRAEARREGFADGERSAGKASELGLWDRYMVALLSGEAATRCPVPMLAAMADDATAERKKRKDRR